MNTTIRVSYKTLNRLYNHKQRAQTYDNLINNLIDLLEQTQNEYLLEKNYEHNR